MKHQEKAAFVFCAALALLLTVSGTAEAGLGAGLSFRDPGVGFDDPAIAFTGELGFAGRGDHFGKGPALEFSVNRAKYANLMLKGYVMTLVETSFFTIPMYMGVGAFLDPNGGSASGKADKGGAGGKGGGKGGKKTDGKGGKGKLLGVGDFLGDTSTWQKGVRVPIGVVVEFNGLPAQVFAEIAFEADMDEKKINNYTAMGFRVFF